MPKKKHHNTGKRHAAIADEPLVQLGIRLPETDKAALVKYCDKHDLSLSKVCRTAINKYIKTTKRPNSG